LYLFNSFSLKVFAFCRVEAMVNMGILAATGIVSALAADFFITPVLLIQLKPFGKRALDQALSPTDHFLTPKVLE
jgi:predicted RND superfamily exporter protein